MRILLLLFFFLIAIPFPVFCQSIGPDFDKTGVGISELKEIVPLGKKGIATIVVDDGESPKVFSIRYFNTDEELIEERQVTLSEDGLPAQIEGAFYWGGYLNILSSLYYPGPRRNHLLLRRYAIPDLEEVSAKLVSEAYTPADLRIPFGYSLSPDSTQLLCYGWSYSLPNDPARVTLNVMDEELNDLWNKTYILPYKNETFYLYGSLLNKDGKVYMLCEDYQGSVSQYSTINLKKIKQVILYADQGMDQPREYVIQSGKLTLTGVRFALEPSGQLVGAGFYRSGNKAQLEGLITFHLDGVANKIDHNLIPVNKNVFKEAATLSDGFRPTSASRYKFSDFSVDHLFVSDSIIYLAGEQVIEDPGNYPPFEFNEILVARIRKGRYLDWMTRLPKRQKGFFEDLTKFSYNAFERDGHFLFLYNNVMDRLEPGLGQTEILEVSTAGEVKRYDVTKIIQSRSPLIPYPVRSWNYYDEKLLLFGRDPVAKKPQLVNTPWDLLLDNKEN